MLKKILLASIFVISAITNVTHAEDDMKTVASKAYVDTKIETKQLKIPAAGQPNVGAGETVMTYTATGNGQIGERGLYSDISSYNANTDADKLITASALNATFTNLPTTPTTKLECANQADGCTLWTIVDQTAYGNGLPDGYVRHDYVYMMANSYLGINNLPISSGYKVEFVFQTTTLHANLSNYIGGRAAGVAAGGGFRLSKLASGGTALNRVLLYGFESGTEYYDPSTQFTANTRYKYTYDNGVCTLESGSSVISTQSFTINDNTSTKWGINAYANGSSYAASPGGIYVYSVKVWNTQGELVMSLVPCTNNEQVPEVGFYDTVSGTFRTASGGTFAAGPEVN